MEQKKDSSKVFFTTALDCEDFLVAPIFPVLISGVITALKNFPQEIRYGAISLPPPFQRYFDFWLSYANVLETYQLFRSRKKEGNPINTTMSDKGNLTDLRITYEIIHRRLLRSRYSHLSQISMDSSHDAGFQNGVISLEGLSGIAGATFPKRMGSGTIRTAQLKLNHY